MVILKKSIILDIHHHKMYMYINFHQNRANRSVITVHTNLFAKNRKLHKFATTNSNFKNRCVLLAQWLTWLTRDHCNPKVPSSIPAGGKDFP